MHAWTPQPPLPARSQPCLAASDPFNHLQDDSRRKLCLAGGWTAKTATAEEYAGLTIEATRHWSRLMVRPVTLL